jgi:hypothetical protein
LRSLAIVTIIISALENSPLLSIQKQPL